VYLIVERKKNHGSQIRNNGHEYETIQAGQCCRKAAYCAFNTPSDNSDPVAHFLASVNDLFEHRLRDVDDSDMVGITIQNQVNQNEKPIGISFKRKDQLSGDVIWCVFEKVSQSNARFNALDTMVMTVHSVKIPVGFGRCTTKSKGRPLSVMAHLKQSIVEVKAEEDCLAHALVIAIARLENDPKYNSYRRGYRIRPVVQNLCEKIGIDLSTAAGIPELVRFQEHFREYKIVSSHGLSCEDIMFEGQVDSSRRINLLYDDVEKHYNVIANLTAAMAKSTYVKGATKHVEGTSRTSATRRVATAWPALRVLSPAFESPAMTAIGTLEVVVFHQPQAAHIEKKSVCERKRCCATCGWVVTHENHECNKRFCENCNKNRDVDHLCYMRPLKDALPYAGDKVFYVLYDFETTQNTKYPDKATLHVPNLVCFKQFCLRCEEKEDGDCVRCGKRKHSFWEDPFGALLSYLTEPRHWANKIIAIAYNAKAFDLQFILNRAILLKWKPDLIMSGLKIMCMKMEHMVFLDRVYFLPCPLRKRLEAFGLAASKSWYPHYFNTEENLEYIGPISDVSY